MSVFLRWGILGILGFAGLMYTYNASKRMAENHAARGAPTATAAQRPAEAEREASPQPPAAAAHCEAELVVARRALQARAQGEPLDRLLRIQEIAFQASPRRERLEMVATRWFNFEGADPIPEALRTTVLGDCEQAGP